MVDSKRAKGKVFRMEANDGFHVEVVDGEEGGGELSRLDLLYRRSDEVVRQMTLSYESAVVQGDVEGEVEAVASLRRGQLLCEALCRFFNTGGSFDEARRLCEGLMANILTVTNGDEVFPIVPLPWGLVDSELGPAKHTFYEPSTGKAVEWVEGQYVKGIRLDEEGPADEAVAQDSEPLANP